MREIDGDPALVDSWNDAMKHQRLKKAAESQSIDLTLLASTPMHDRLTFERAQAVEEKMAESVRRGGGSPGKAYQGWMAEIDRQVAHHERGRAGAGPSGGERQSSSSSSSVVPRKRSRRPSSVGREGSYAESSRSAASQRQRISVAMEVIEATPTLTPTTSDGDTDTVDSVL